MCGVGMKRSATRLPTSRGSVPAGQSPKCLFCASALALPNNVQRTKMKRVFMGAHAG